MNEQQLATHLRATPRYITEHRTRVNPVAYKFKQLPNAPRGFGPRSPLNDEAVMLADEEGGTVGRLARYCQDQGTIPRFPLKGFWWVNGRCLGLRSGDDLTHFRAVIRQLLPYTPEIIATEGVGPYLDAMTDIRHVSQVMFPDGQEVWLSLEQAVAFTGTFQKSDGSSMRPVKPETIIEWADERILPTLDRRWGLMVSREHLRYKLALTYAVRRFNAIKAREMRLNRTA